MSFTRLLSGSASGCHPDPSGPEARLSSSTGRVAGRASAAAPPGIAFISHLDIGPETPSPAGDLASSSTSSVQGTQSQRLLGQQDPANRPVATSSWGRGGFPLLPSWATPPHRVRRCTPTRWKSPAGERSPGFASSGWGPVPIPCPVAGCTSSLQRQAECQGLATAGPGRASRSRPDKAAGMAGAGWNGGRFFQRCAAVRGNRARAGAGSSNAAGIADTG